MSDDTSTPEPTETPKPPAAKKPARKPAAQKPAAQKPAAQKPAGQKPAGGKAEPGPTTRPIPVVQPKPVEPEATAAAAVEPAATKPAAAKPAATQPTEVLAPAAAATAVAPEPEVVVVPAPKRKRRRWPWILGGILLILAILLTIAFFVGDAYARNYARDYIKQRIVAVLGIDDPSQVKVDIGTGSVLLQALAGRLNEVDIDAGKVTFGTLTGVATVHAEDVPLDANAKTSKLDVTFAVAEKDVVAAVGSNLSSLPIDSITLTEPDIVVKATLPVFVFSIPVGMSLEPSAVDGQVVLTPSHIQLFDQDYTIDEAHNQLGGLADQLLTPQSMCVNESLPAALTIVDVDVVKKDLVIKINGDGVALGGTDLSTPGTCAK
ncbi:MAG TPA: DUF2993 domain-containing protein [Pseudolysinimonas sp.]|nr:DUF2993 domain-containing protein [Pseudolysinimonas sp.]